MNRKYKITLTKYIVLLIIGFIPIIFIVKIFGSSLIISAIIIVLYLSGVGGIIGKVQQGKANAYLSNKYDETKRR
ncbi:MULTISPECIES: hypothetical protein [Clostridium]|uniref:hypothetical protein n=1 Tax=Clostridium TaxID=1485 RepID=UPI000825BB62|nr:MULTISPECIES: hypothetical protein [Clostridium]PJI09966.1 hypothetical protein CUB90_19760 [Clostridium sp. CT7]